MDSEKSAIHNPFLPIPADLQAAPPANAKGYYITKESTIDPPLIGSLLIAGKNTSQIADTIRVKLRPYLKNPTVLVRLASIRITILGEVNKPGTYTYNYYGFTLPQAIGLAGDLTAYARRDQITIIRQEGEHRSFAHLDITNSKILNSLIIGCIQTTWCM